MKILILLSSLFISSCATMGNYVDNSDNPNLFYSGRLDDGTEQVTVVQEPKQFYYIDKTNGAIFVNQHEIIELNAPADRTLLPLGNMK